MMDQDDRPKDPEALLREAGWLRRLACGIVGPEVADDVVQSTWLAAIEHPPRTKGVRSWLRSVVTNFAYRARWRERKRPTVERAGARPEALPSTAELVGQISLQRRVVDEVLALEEPYRATVILVFFHDLSAAEVARRLGIPSSTVRTRLHRALARLRERLDRGGSDWRATIAGFAGISHLVPGVTSATAAAGASSAAVASGVILMTAKMKILVCSAVAVVAGLVLWRYELRTEPVSDEPIPVPPISAASRAMESSPADPIEARSAVPVTKPIAPRRFVETESGPESAPARLGSMLVKLVWQADKTPAADVPFTVIAWGRQDPYMNELRLRSDATGVLRVGGMRPGSITVSSIWGGRSDGKIEAGKELELGVEIPPGPAVEGIVVDSGDRPVPHASILSGDLGGIVNGERVGTSGADGTFRLPSTRSETWLVIGAVAEGHLPSPLAILTGKAGATLRTRLVLGEAGVELSGKVTDPGGTPVAGAIVQVGDGEDKQFTQRDGTSAVEAVTFRTRTDGDGAFRFGTRPGKTQLIVRAEKYAPWRREVDIGETGLRGMPVVLQHGATIVGKVLDSAGAPLGGVELTAGEQAWTLEGFMARTKQDGTFRLEGVSVGEVPIKADGNEKGKASATLHTASGEMTEWIAKLSTGGEVKGRVVDERGAGLPGCFVEVQSAGTKEWESKFATTDNEGRFAATNCSQPQYMIQVRDPQGGTSAIARVDGVKPGGAELVIQIADEARATGFIAGILVGPDGKPIPAQISPWRLGDNGSPVLSPDAKTGSFKIGPMPPSDYTLNIRADGFPAWRRESLHVERDKTLDLGTIKLESGGTLVVALTREGGGEIGEPWILARAAADGATSHLSIAGGEARSGPLAAGRYVLRVGGNDVVSQDFPFEIRIDETTELKVTLLTGVKVVLRFDDPLNAAESKRIRVTIKDGSGANMVTREAQRHPQYPFLEVTVGLRRGTYELEAVADDTGRRCTASFAVPPSTAENRINFDLK